MNRIILLLFFSMFAGNLFSQSVYPYEEIKLDKPSECKAAEPFALSAASFLLSTPFKQKDSNRERSFNFLVRWTAVDRDYDFRIQGVILDLAGEKDLMQLFIAAMTKFCLENKALGSNARIIETNAVKMVLDYCNDPANNFTLKKKIRKKLESN